MRTANTRRRVVILRQTLAAAAIAVAIGSLFAVGGIGRAYAGDDEVEDTVDTKFMRNILSGLGLKREGDDPGIDYHERSPLVVPPTRDLPPPDTGIAATNNPAWPKDPDVKRAKAVKRAVKNTVAAEEEDMRQLRPDELRGTGRADRTASANTGAQAGGARPEQLSPSQLGHEGFNLLKMSTWKNMFDREGTTIPFVAEPQRSALTDPPPGLRTPSPKYQYGNKNKLEPTTDNNPDAPVGVR
ncbi:MAG: hypothetical protein ACXWKC_06455 [Xanthobacteraceae bacterium]